MSIWSRIADAISALAKGESLADVLARLRTPPEQTVGFTIAVIALGAKMAKADGHVTRNEVTAFREVFHIAPEDEDQAARVYNLARQDVAGFELYAERIHSMFRTRPAVLHDLLEGLFHIALSDGALHPAEEEFLREVARRFEIPEREFDCILARYCVGERSDPYAVLGVTPEMTLPEIRKRWHKLVRETHPDSMMARGVPEEAVNLANRRLAAINAAWESIQHGHAHA